MDMSSDIESKGRIIIVDDEESILMLLTEFLRGNGYEVDPFTDSRDALSALKTGSYHILITDLSMPKIDGLQLISYIQKEYINTLGIVITGYGTMETAINAMRSGAFDYILKPFKLEDILSTVESAIYYYRLLKSENINKELSSKANLMRRFSQSRLLLENALLKDCLREKYRFNNIIGMSLGMQKVFELIEKVADTNATTLITGESGVGKELVAKAIHYNSSRKDNPIIVVNCGAIPENLLESELFGYEKGAFTGAYNTKHGKFEVADKGTIFLDEIGDMSLSLQVKLLRVLQEKTFERIGGAKTIKVDIRFIAATNRDLEKMVKDGQFREDLYYRLNVVPIHIPPLRERKQDIPLLLNYFLEHSNRLNDAAVEGFDDNAMEVLMAYDYPGNVRELNNIVERVVVLKKKGIITIDDLPEKLWTLKEKEQQIDIQRGYETLVTEFEKAIIMKALKETKGVKSKAATILNINRTTLIEKMKRFGME
ncbi:MAG TPA: sigma-54 dependent transcriptional regulator [Syntrophorhabdaceae bacterium]|nr:sigma-54 dependent transcriptional regulator [Syntrophorhabdaceae bacterium]HPP05964.1 sigma-54 dependent transcriptional regulator [Syntrophorhabdaceae bacterium]HRR71990.1 sigma-54 dependent transcriptional regulator [Syntrophorhabdaceae bacterium]